MRNTIAGRAGLAGTLLVAGLCAGVAPAQAAPQPGVANIGSADFTKAGAQIKVPTQGKCSVDGPTSATAQVVAKTGITFGGGTSSCTTTVTDPNTDATTTTSTATGKNFELSALVSAGGPRVKLSTFTVKCVATQTQTNANWGYGGMSGIPNPPSPVPVGYVSPIKKSNGTVLANAVFNIQNLPGDGSIGLTMLRIDFLPASGVSGQVVLGHTSCSPTP
ncbi:hypothetical protein SAMN05421837_105593 [Amycolatopsis pretoriensis]|uniref:Neocarzinostatin family protein n=1 Tax=Amycolatopsis pretoriensis TaxID=218821 RepID=A0A1H5R0L6_9PSEU|nr:hypothetical protein [Amycolatopsis pretoriensis]SEF31118.1 hypothetical protein SAMN05421837_105593 [Amycolatopsis pretoriensis]